MVKVSKGTFEPRSLGSMVTITSARPHQVSSSADPSKSTFAGSVVVKPPDAQGHACYGFEITLTKGYASFQDDSGAAGVGEVAYGSAGCNKSISYEYRTISRSREIELISC